MRTQDIENYINTFIFDGSTGGFICNDIRKAIDSGLNYLTALGLLSYTEFIGSLMPQFSSNLATTANMRGNKANFYKFYYRLGRDYILFDKRLVEWLGGQNGVYTVYRGGLSHAYFIGGNLKIGTIRYNLSSVVAKTSNSSMGFTKEGKLGFATEKYFSVFLDVVSFFRKKISEEKDTEWTNAFLEGSNLRTHSLG